MKIAFVRFTTSYRGEVSSPRVLLVNGEAAENHENFRAWYIWVSGDDEIVILNWFEVPKDWENLVAGDGCMHDALEALIALDALADTPVVSDLLATIFEEGYRLAEKKERKLEAALNALLVS